MSEPFKASVTTQSVDWSLFFHHVALENRLRSRAVLVDPMVNPASGPGCRPPRLRSRPCPPPPSRAGCMRWTRTRSARFYDKRVLTATLVFPGKYELIENPLPEPEPGCVLVRRKCQGSGPPAKHSEPSGKENPMRARRTGPLGFAVITPLCFVSRLSLLLYLSTTATPCGLAPPGWLKSTAPAVSATVPSDWITSV
jgi:hypothetical protein